MKNKSVLVVTLLILLLTLTPMALRFESAHANPTEWHVYSGDSIQAAINAASPGDTIIVHDGTYDEQVVIDKNLTLQGASTPIIKPSSADKLTTVLSGYFWGGTKQIAGIIVANIAGGNVTVKDLIIDGENITAKPTGADYVAGIFYRETGGTIDTVTVANMTIGTTGTAVRGYGIYLSAIANAVSIEVKGSTLRNYDKNGIDAHGNKLTVNIHHNTLTGRGPLPNSDEVQNGILIMDGAIGTVDSNTISNMSYIPETWWCAGIMFYSSGCSAASNTITDTQIGIIFQDASGSAEDNTVVGGAVGLLGLWAQYTTGGTWTISFVGNTISGSKDSPGYENAAIGAQTYDDSASLTVTIDNNQLTGDGSTTADGIYIGDVPAASPAGTITPTIRGNVISGWQNGIRLESSVDTGSISDNNIDGTYLGILVRDAISVEINNNRITDFVKGGIVTRGVENILVEGNIISTTIYDEAPNGIDIGTYSGTKGTIKGNEISGCSWKDFTGDYETSWSGSGILVIESGDSLELLGNTVYECDVGMDIESDSMNITCNEVHNNIYGFVFWNAKPKVNYNNIYSNTQYGVYRTALGDLTGVLDARYNWWGHASGPNHSTNPTGLGDKVTDYVSFRPWLQAKKVPPLVHDVGVISITATPNMVKIGDTVHINVTVKNKGNTFENITLTTTYGSNTKKETINDFAPGTETTFQYNWDTTGESTCIHTIAAIANPVPGETHIADNFKSTVVAIVSKIPPSANLKVEPSAAKGFVRGYFEVNVTISDLDVYWDMAGFDIKLYYNTTMLNATEVRLGAFATRFNLTYEIVKEINDAEGYVELAYMWDMAHLTPEQRPHPYGSGTLFTIRFLVTAEGQGDLTFEFPSGFPLAAFPNATKWCSDTAEPIRYVTKDGTVETKLPWIEDINADGKVDILDVVMATSAYATRPGDRYWNPYVDLNGDNFINILDLVTITRVYGLKQDP